MSGDVEFRCSHYKRKCKYIAPCCDKVYMCRVCHDDHENHEMDRKLVKEVECMKCKTRQKFQKECESCGLSFGVYCCHICHLLDDEDKDQFHCDKCGICRIGGVENYFHCEKCDICLGTQLKDNHKCIEKASHDACSICLEFLHTSRLQLHVPKCGHLLHRDCYIEYLKSGQYSCPNCGVSMIEMNQVWEDVDEEIKATQMPEEYKDLELGILCKDCHKTSKVKFHVLGLKCQSCGSYNTCRE